MKRWLRSALVSMSLAACAAGWPAGAAPQAGQPDGAGSPPAQVTLSGYELFEVKLSAPRRARGADGVERTWDRAYAVRLRAELPEPEGLHVVLYVGDWRVPEYGGWKEGVYFFLYDPALLRRLEGKPFAYSVARGKRRATRLVFSSRTEAPMPVLDEQEFRRQLR